MALDFPTPTTVGQVFTQGSLTYTWDGAKWVGQSSAGGVQDKIVEGNTEAEVVDTGSDGHFIVTTEGSPRLKIDSSGNVGIGTLSPQSSLSVAGSIPNSPSTEGVHLGLTSNYAVMQLNGNTGGIIDFAEAGVDNAGRIIYTHSTDAMQFSTGTSERMRIDSSGNVQIGSTNSDSFKFKVTNGAGTLARFTDGASQTLDIRQASGGIELQNPNNGFISFKGSSTERMRIDSSGNVGIGTSSPTESLEVVAASPTITSRATGNNSGKLAVSNDRAADVIGGQILGQWNGNTVSRIDFRNGADGVNKDDGEIAFGTSSASSNTVERMRITSDGKLGLGTSSPYKLLQVGDATTVNSNNAIAFGKRVSSTQTSSPLIGQTSADGASNDLGICATSSSGSILFYTGNGQAGFGSGSNDERMRIISNGDVLFGQSTTGSPGFGNTVIGAGFDKSANSFIVSASSGPALKLNRNSSNGAIVRFSKNGSATASGSITVATSSVAYNTSSDYRLKENVVDLDGAIARFNQLAPKRFNFIANADTTVDGFLAHEAQDVVPECVTGTKDETEDIGTLTEWDGTVLETDSPQPEELTWEQTTTDEDGNETTQTRTRTWEKTGEKPVYQGIDQAKLVPLLTAALQEAIAKIETLEQRLSDAGL